MNQPKPDGSLIIGTVSTGAGLGLMFLLAMARLFHATAPSPNWWRALWMAAGLITFGVLACAAWWRSPASAWARGDGIRPAWLTHAARGALALYPLGLAYALAVGAAWRAAEMSLGLLLMANCLLVLIATGMVFAAYRDVMRWQTWHTRFGPPLLGLMLGALLLSASVPPAAAPVAARMAVVLVVLGAVIKLSYFIRFADEARDPSTGRSPGLSLLKLAMFMLGFVAPFVLLSLSAAMAPVACALAVVGRLIEQWLFLREARTRLVSEPVS